MTAGSSYKCKKIANIIFLAETTVHLYVWQSFLKTGVLTIFFPEGHPQKWEV